MGSERLNYLDHISEKTMQNDPVAIGSPIDFENCEQYLVAYIFICNSYKLYLLSW